MEKVWPPPAMLTSQARLGILAEPLLEYGPASLMRTGCDSWGIPSSLPVMSIEMFALPIEVANPRRRMSFAAFELLPPQPATARAIAATAANERRRTVGQRPFTAPRIRWRR